VKASISGLVIYLFQNCLDLTTSPVVRTPAFTQAIKAKRIWLDGTPTKPQQISPFLAAA